MALIIKACLILSSLIGVATAISIPISMMASASHSKRNSDDGIGYLAQESLEQISEEERESERWMSFDDLWSEVEQDFQRNNKTLGSPITTWKNNLKVILNSKEDKWELQEKHWKSCIGVEQIFCGYLVFKEKTNTDYKVQIIYDNKQNENKWKVKIIKNSGGVINYYDRLQRGWVAKSTPNNFHELKRYDDEFSNKQWEKINPWSIWNG